MQIPAQSRRKEGFSLVEMLIVVAILGFLLSLLSPAILKQVRISTEKRAATERSVLQAAIQEYWHDQGEWPIKSGLKPQKNGHYYDEKLVPHNSNSNGDLDGNAFKVIYEYKNNEVFDQLRGVAVSGGTKDYIDPKAHNTTSANLSNRPFDKNAISVYDALFGKNGRVNNPVFVYWTYRVQCPHCGSDDAGSLMPMGTDQEKCNKGHSLKRADRKNVVRILKPFKVTFDMLNNGVKVE